MAIEPFIKCSDISVSIKFYSEILDFEVLQPPDPDPNAFMSKYALLGRQGDLLHLSSHSGDGVYGNVIYVRVDDIDLLYTTFVDNGLNTENPTQNPGLRIKLVTQTWGMKEFSVSDPDGNKLTFGQQLL